MTITVLGSGGFIGGALVDALRGDGVRVEAPPRLPGDAYFSQLRGPLGHVVYCIGLTADFRDKPFETVDAHVNVLRRVLSDCDFETLTYLSSTRVYIRSAGTREDAALSVDPAVPEDLFNASKLTGEALCLSSGKPCRIARVSNVFGEADRSSNFLTSVLSEAAATGRVTIRLSPQSAKDYVDVRDVVTWLAKIATGATQRIYNVASGRNTSNAEIADALRALGVDVTFAPGGATVAFPPIDVARLTGEFGAARYEVTQRIPDLLAAFKRRA